MALECVQLDEDERATQRKASCLLVEHELAIIENSGQATTRDGKKRQMKISFATFIFRVLKQAKSKGELVACLLSMSKPSSKKWPSYHERREEEEAHDGIRQIFLGETLITTCSGTPQVRMDQIKKCNVFYGRDCT